MIDNRLNGLVSFCDGLIDFVHCPFLGRVLIRPLIVIIDFLGLMESFDALLLFLAGFIIFPIKALLPGSIQHCLDMHQELLGSPI